MPHVSRLASTALVLLLSVGCASQWTAGPTVLADPRAVALALGDPPPSARTNASDLPHVAAPHHDRSCCAFGMDMHVDFAGMAVPFFEVGNIIAPDALGRHAYDLPTAATDPETNGLIYTCRGGWIDTAHVREDADVALFLTLRIAEGLRTGTTIEIPGHGATTTITVAPVSAQRISEEGLLEMASALAAWATFRISIWHEVSTWFGYQSVAGFSEKPSAFSLEDLYSNALGIHLAGAIIEENGFRDEDDYDQIVNAFIEEALQRLDAQPLETSRAIMGSLDGLWWDSTRRLPDNHLVLRRHFPSGESTIAPFRAEDAFAEGSVPEPLATVCRGAETRTLALTHHVGRTSARELIDITWAPDAWANNTFPFANETHIVDERELEHLMEVTHTQLEADLGIGPGFDQPGPI